MKVRVGGPKQSLFEYFKNGMKLVGVSSGNCPLTALPAGCCLGTDSATPAVKDVAEASVRVGDISAALCQPRALSAMWAS